MNDPQRQIANEMMEFLKEAPSSAGLQKELDEDYLYNFEAARNLIVRDCLHQFGFRSESKFSILDFGYLTGITQEFTHRAFPHANFTVFDHPDSPNFGNPVYMRLIGERKYVDLHALDLSTVSSIPGLYDVVILGEIIEHLDPTTIVKLLDVLKKSAKPETVLIITTPNAAGLYNCYVTLTASLSVIDPPIKHPVHNYGHIHLWIPHILNRTAEYCGWTPKEVIYYHGRDAENFVRAKRKWRGLKATIVLRGIELLANRKPRLKGYFISTFKNNPSK